MMTKNSRWLCLVVTATFCSLALPACQEEDGIAVLSVAPEELRVTSTAGIADISVINAGDGLMMWSASVTSGADWLVIETGNTGLNDGTITFSYTENTSLSQRTASIEILASQADTVTVTVAIVQDAAIDITIDSDNDGLSLLEEVLAESDPEAWDTDSDGLSDGDEYHLYGTSPTVPDSDADEVTDGEELASGTDPLLHNNAPAEYTAISKVLNILGRQIQTDCETMSLEEALLRGATYLKSQPNVLSASFTDEEGDQPTYLYVEFIDSTVYVLNVEYISRDDFIQFEDLDDVAIDETEAKSGMIQSMRSKTFSSKDFPDSRCVFADAISGDKVVSELRDKLMLPDYSVDIFTRSEVDVNFFKTLSSYGVVYISAHGGTYTPESAVSTNKRTYVVIRTNQQDDPDALDKPTDDDFAQYRVLRTHSIRTMDRSYALHNPFRYFTLFNPVVYYAITDEFINHYSSNWKRHSIVYLDSCMSASVSPISGRRPMFDAFSNHNVKTILGNDSNVGMSLLERTARLFFARMRGDSSIGLAHVNFRPQTVNEAYSYAKACGLKYPSMYSQNLILGPDVAGHTPILNPMIFSASVDPQQELLTIRGEFGVADIYNVSIGDLPLQASPVAGGIETKISETASGTIKVTVKGHVSNEVPLTEWKGRLDITGEIDKDRGPSVEASIEMRFRGDIHKTGSVNPDAKPSPRMAEMKLENDGKFDYHVFGKFRDSAKSSSNMTYEYIENKGSVTVLESRNHETDQAFIDGKVTLRPNSVTAHLAITAEVLSMAIIYNEDTDQYSSECFPVKVLPLDFTIPMGEDGTIHGDSLKVPGTNLTARWGDFEVKNAPTEDTAAS